MKWRSALGVLALLMILSSVVFAASFSSQRKIVKQTGGSTGDSVTAAADTSSAITLAKNYTAWHVIAAGDSAMRYTVQVSPNGTNWFDAVVDSITAGQAEATAALSLAYGGWQVCVITDMIPAGGAAFGTAYLATAK